MTCLLRLLSLVPPCTLAPVLLVSLLSLALGIGLLGASAWLIASAALEPPLYTLAIGITCVRACGLGRSVFRYLERFLSHRAAFSGLTRIRLALFDRAAALLPLAAGPARQGAFLYDLLTGADALRDFFVRALLPPLAVGSATGLLAALLARLLGASGLLLPLLFALRLCLSLVAEKNGEQQRRAHGGAYRSLLLDMTEGRAELAAANNRPACARLTSSARALLASDCRAACRAADADARAAIMDAALLLLLLALLAPHVSAGDISGVTLAVLLLVLQALLSAWATLPDAMRQLRQSLAAARRLLPDAAGPTAERPTGSQPAAPVTQTARGAVLLRAAHLSFAYPGRAPVFSDLSFTLRRGEHTAIVGASGAGKTTLALLLLGVWPPAHGTLALGGTPYPALPPAAITRAIAALPQGSVLFCHSIRENFRRYRPHASAAGIRAALRTACLEDVVRALPGGIDAPLGPDACHLSGGQRCRLLTALALAGDEPVLLLDEPTAGLDAATAGRLLDALFAHAKAAGKTLLVITHAHAILPRFAQVLSLSP